MTVKRSILLLLPLVLALLVPCTAGADEPWWSLTSSVKPTVLQRGGEGIVGFRALNVGNAVANGEGCAKVGFGTGKYMSSACIEEATEPGTGEWERTPIVLTIQLPAGVSVQKVPAGSGEGPKVSLNRFPETEEAAGEKCVEPAPRQVSCTIASPLSPYEFLEAAISVEVEPGAASADVADAEVSGAGAAATRIEHPLSVGEPGAQTPFGVEALALVPEEEGGAVQAQAGAHPYQLTTTFALNQTADTLSPPALPRNLTFTLPPGLVANAVAFPRCSELDFLSKGGGTGFADLCPADTAVGAVLLHFHQPDFGQNPTQTYPIPLFNLQPKQGEPVRFGFWFDGISVPIDFHIRAGGDYGASAEVQNITQVANFISESLTVWGVPGDPSHDAARGWTCLAEGFYRTAGQKCETPEEAHPPPFLTLPTSCGEPFAASVSGESWPVRATPGVEPQSSIPLPETKYSLKDGFERPLGIGGCNELGFAPFIEASPDVASASTSTGLKVDVRVPQEDSENADGLASSSVKDITVALPPGVQVNPAGGNGLEACGEGQVGFEPDRGENGFEEFNPVTEPKSKTPLFSPTVPEPLSPGLNLGAEGFCPNSSKIGTVKIKSPLIANPVEGSVYLASQNANPFGSLLATYIVAEDPASGVLVKLPGKNMLCQSAGEVIAGETCQTVGQIVSTFENEPQLPFEDAELHFFGGERAPLATPARCGTYTTDATFTPWSGGRPVTATSAFAIGSGPKTPAQADGSPCPGPTLPFSPSLTGGAVNVSAGAFGPLTTTIAREDGQQNMQSVQLHMPAGLEGILAGVPLCPEAQANVGTCPAGSLIGETTVQAGVGNDPVSVRGGRVYLTEKYAGAPFGLSIVNPVKAGPFDLEHDTANPAQDPSCDCVVVRAKIEVNPQTAELTITTDPSGPHAVPRLIDGIPVQIKAVNVTVNREHFTFNPTNCNPLAITGTIVGDEGGSSPVSVPFQIHDCANLRFTPTLAVSTAATASKVNGASLHFKIAYPKNAVGSQSWMKEMKFDIPKQLPARLTTIQKACLAATFEHNRGACPPASIIGHVLVHTPVLPVPLEGPLYFVSYGGAAFPDAVAVIKGYGVTIESHGKTFINGKTGVTSATFESVPDVPFESIEVTVPQGPYSEFGANLPHGKLNFCGQKLVMPILFKAQNGLEIHKNVPVGVSGCKAPTRKQKLAAALKQCRKKHRHNKARRQSCERAARRKYATKASGTAKQHRPHK